MGCKSCSTGGCGTKGGGAPQGCKNNGACSTGGCNKMNVFDWLSNMDVPAAQQFDVVEIKFKGGRKEYFRNTNKLELYTGDYVVVEVPSGHHIGAVSLQGELVRLQMIKKSVANDDTLKSIYRVATDKDLEKHEQSIARDLPTMYRTREIIKELNVNMKLSDVEYQADGTKATFYYSSDERVDFRELIKVLATEFKVRVEMKQINLRQEAARLGGIGVCGRELCCSTWLTDFKNVNTSAARYQNLSLNPSKLSGQCGRLKCCLNYELETYMDALRDIPAVEGALLTQKGEATLQKTDIFKRIMWFGYSSESTWYPVPVDRVKEILELNKQGTRPMSFEILDDSSPEITKTPQTPATLNSDLERLDQKFSKGNQKKKKNKPRPDGRPDRQGAKPTATKPEGESQVAKPTQEPRNDNRDRGQRPNRPDQRGPRPTTPRPEGEEGGQQQHRSNQASRPDNRPQRSNQGPNDKSKQQGKPPGQNRPNPPQPQEGQPPKPQNNASPQEPKANGDGANPPQNNSTRPNRNKRRR